MWRDYSFSSIKKNKASSITIMISALIAAFFLSFICGLFYNMWQDGINRIIQKEGDWQGRICGQISEEDIVEIAKQKEISRIECQTDLDEEKGKTIDIWFNNSRRIYEELPEVVQRIGLQDVTLQYHDVLLSEYLIFDPQDEQPPLLLLFYLVVMLVVCISLVMIIKNAFAISVDARIHQMGMLKSIGATPRQLLTCLVQEAVVLSALPILLGAILGIGGIYAFFCFANRIAVEYSGTEVVFYYKPAVFFLAIVASVMTVIVSVWIPANRISRMPPLEAIRNPSQKMIPKKRKYRILALLFGAEGEIAGSSMRLRKKAFRTSTISFALSFLAFSMFLCFTALSGISTRYTYFERYKNTWDIMATMKNQNMRDITEEMEKITQKSEVKSCITYQKAMAHTFLTKEQFSDELNNLGGLTGLAGNETRQESGSLISVPLVILDDDSFLNYCEGVGIKASTNGVIIWNQIWNSIESNFRYREYVPFINENISHIILDGANQEDKIETSVLGYSDILPDLREEYEDYGLVTIVSESEWNNWKKNDWLSDNETRLCILAKEESIVGKIEESVRENFSAYDYEIENRIQEQDKNDQMQTGYMLIIGTMCGILALIGVANVFANTAGLVYQRKREFARYLTIGISPMGIRKMLGIEAFILAGKPLIMTIPITIAFVIFAVKASCLNMADFIEVMPIGPIVFFALIIFLAVAFAYYIGGRKIQQTNLMDVLRDETML